MELIINQQLHDRTGGILLESRNRWKDDRLEEEEKMPQIKLWRVWTVTVDRGLWKVIRKAIRKVSSLTRTLLSVVTVSRVSEYQSMSVRSRSSDQDHQMIQNSDHRLDSKD